MCCKEAVACWRWVTGGVTGRSISPLSSSLHSVLPGQHVVSSFSSLDSFMTPLCLRASQPWTEPSKSHKSLLSLVSCILFHWWGKWLWQFLFASPFELDICLVNTDDFLLELMFLISPIFYLLFSIHSRTIFFWKPYSNSSSLMMPYSMIQAWFTHLLLAITDN